MPVAIRNPCRHQAARCSAPQKTDSHDQFANWSRNDKVKRSLLQLLTMLSLRGHSCPWQSVTPAAIGGAVLCTAENGFPRPVCELVSE